MGWFTRSTTPPVYHWIAKRAEYEACAYVRLAEVARDRHRHTHPSFWGGGAPHDPARVYWQAQLEAANRISAEMAALNP